MSKIETNTIWIDGKFFPAEQATISALTHTLHYGVGAFEGLRAYKTKYGSAIFRLNCHTKRFFNSAKILNMIVPFDVYTLNQAQKAILQQNNLESAYIRPLIFYGAEHLGLHTKSLSSHVMIAAWQWQNYWDKAIAQPVKMQISSFSRQALRSGFCHAKACGNYLQSVAALQQANLQGFDDAILLDQQGCIAEGSGANIFVVSNQRLLTPKTRNILPGITRDTIFHIANHFNIEVIETDITREQLYTADEVFLTGTAVEVTPVIQVDHCHIGRQGIGEITQLIADNYQKIVHGELTINEDWLSFI